MRAISVAAFGVLVGAGFAQPALADENPKPRAAGTALNRCHTLGTCLLSSSIWTGH